MTSAVEHCFQVGRHFEEGKKNVLSWVGLELASADVDANETRIELELTAVAMDECASAACAENSY